MAGMGNLVWAFASGFLVGAVVVGLIWAYVAAQEGVEGGEYGNEDNNLR